PEFPPLDELEYGWVGVGQHEGSRNPLLFIYSIDNVGTGLRMGHSAIPISRDLPLAQQPAVTIHVVIHCYGADGRAYKRRSRFSIAPDPGSQVGYKIAPSRSQLVETLI